MSDELRRLLDSGELVALARQSTSRADLARMLGMSEQALRKRLESRGMPTYSALKYDGNSRLRACHTDSVERSHANAAGRPHVEDASHEHGPNCTYEVGGRWSCEYPADFAEEERTQERVPVFDVSDATPGTRGHLPLLPPGHRYSGVSTLLDGDGNVRAQWQKTNVSKEQYREALLRAVAEVAEPYRGEAMPAPTPDVDADLLAVYCLGDPHLGLLAWSRESGMDHDLDIGKRELFAGVDHLVAEAPAADTALILSLGDLVHFDNEAGTTTAGTKQDADTRWFKVMIETVWTMRRCIDRALEKHRQVIGWLIRGNHDRHASAGIAIALAMYYEDNPRVRIDLTPDPYSWLRFGKVLIGANHSDENSKPEKLAGVMACDRAEDWGQTLYRYMLCGHLHHTFAKEEMGVLVERFPTLAPKDAWHHAKGYRAQQSMCVDVYHREYGRRSRRTVGIRQLRAA